jgi:hypothetical protein
MADGRDEPRIGGITSGRPQRRGRGRFAAPRGAVFEILVIQVVMNQELP